MTDAIDPIILEILKESGGTFAWELTKWTTIGACCGAILMPLIFFLLNSLNAYRLDWTYAKACRIITFILTLILSICLFGFIGFNQGFLVAVKLSLKNDKFVNTVLPPIGSTGADLLAHIYIMAPLYERASKTADNDTTPTDFIETSNARLDEFRDGKWELDLDELSERIISAKKTFIHDVATQMNSDLSSKYPELSEEVGDKLFNWISEHFVEWIIQDELESSGLMHWIRAGLIGFEEAALSDPAVTHSELSIVIGEILVNKGIISPVRVAVIINQFILALSLVGVFGAPVLIIRASDYVKSRNSPELKQDQS